MGLTPSFTALFRSAPRHTGRFTCASRSSKSASRHRSRKERGTRGPCTRKSAKAPLTCRPRETERRTRRRLSPAAELPAAGSGTGPRRIGVFCWGAIGWLKLVGVCFEGAQKLGADRNGAVETCAWVNVRWAWMSLGASGIMKVMPLKKSPPIFHRASVGRI